MELEDYQLTLITQVRAALRHSDRVVAVLPTGGGKTICAAALAAEEVSNGGRVLFLAPWRPLIPQTIARFRQFGIERVGALMAGSPHDLDAPVQVGSVESVRRWVGRLDWRPTLTIVDEAHRYDTPPRRALLAALRVPMVLLSATPWTTKGGGLERIADSIVAGPSSASLVTRGRLAEPVMYSADPTLVSRIDQLSRRGEDFDQAELTKAMNRTELVSDIVSGFSRIVGKKAKGLVFGVSVAHSRALCERFRSAGYAAEHIDGDTRERERRTILEAFGQRQVTVLCNCCVFIEGFDDSDIDGGIIRPTNSFRRYVQMVGRLIRVPYGKSRLTVPVLDPGGNVFRFGSPMQPIEHSLQRAPEPAAPPPGVLKADSTGRVVRADMLQPHVVELEGELEIEDGSAADADVRLQHLRRIAASTGYGPLWVCQRFEREYGHAPPSMKQEVRKYLLAQVEGGRYSRSHVNQKLTALFGSG